MNTPPSTLFVFVDGLGLGPEDPETNPVWRVEAPTLQRLLRELARPVDASLGVDGLPQSATGQAALYTGANSARAIGGHQEGFPGPSLRALIRKRNLFSVLRRRGYRCAFANSYYLEGVRPEEFRRRRSVTTIMTLDALGDVRRTDHLLAGKAVHHDLTREILRGRGYHGPLCTPEQAALDLVGIASENDLTLFEFFLTDLMAHRGSPEQIEEILIRLDRFLKGVVSFGESPGRLFLLCSDHGNIEDGRTRTHTRNPVPWVALGEQGASLTAQVRGLEDVTPAILTLFPERDS